MRYKPAHRATAGTGRIMPLPIALAATMTAAAAAGAYLQTRDANAARELLAARTHHAGPAPTTAAVRDGAPLTASRSQQRHPIAAAATPTGHPSATTRRTPAQASASRAASARRSADLAARARRAAAAKTAVRLRAGEVYRLPDGTLRPSPALGTPIRGNGWTLDRDVRAWVAQSLTTLYANGFPQDDDDFINIATIVYNESGGDPQITNGWDANAAAGRPSFGLMQTIGTTFTAYALPGHASPSDPVAQVMAGARYATDRYGTLGAVPGLRSLATGGPYLPY